MTRTQFIARNTNVESAKMVKFNANIASHPARSSMAQSLAGEGNLVFEGELLDAPFAWHPSGTRH